MKDNSSMVIIVEGRMPKNMFLKMKSSTKTTQDGIDIFAKEETEGALIDGRLFFTKKGHMGDVITLVKGKSKASLASAAGGKALRETIKHAPTKSHLWGAIVLPQKDKDKTVAAQMPVDAASFGFTFSSDLEGTVRLETPSPASAEASLKMITGVMPQLKMGMSSIGLDVAAGTLALAQDKAAINAVVKVTQTELKTLFAMAMAKRGGPPPTTKPSGPPPPAPTGGLGAAKKN
jgi:hypothetical protein